MEKDYEKGLLIDYYEMNGNDKNWQQVNSWKAREYNGS